MRYCSRRRSCCCTRISIWTAMPSVPVQRSARRCAERAKAYILIEEEIPLNLRFWIGATAATDADILAEVDVSVCVDCGDEAAFRAGKQAFRQGKTTVCIDHHHTTSSFCDYNYVDRRRRLPEADLSTPAGDGHAAGCRNRRGTFCGDDNGYGQFQYSIRRNRPLRLPLRSVTGASTATTSVWAV